MTRWRTVPVIPDTRMTTAFAAEIRRQPALLPVGTTAHEPLGPLWDAILAVAPECPLAITPGLMARSATEGWNAAIETLCRIADRVADDIAATCKRPLAEGFAFAALAELAAAGRDLLIRPDPRASATALNPNSNAPAPAGQLVEAT